MSGVVILFAFTMSRVIIYAQKMIKDETGERQPLQPILQSNVTCSGQAGRRHEKRGKDRSQPLSIS